MNFKRKSYFIILSIVLAWLISSIDHPSLVFSQSHNGVSKLTCSPPEIKFDLRVPWKELIIDKLAEGSEEYVQLHLPGWSNLAVESAPALPYLSKAFGVPPGTKISISVIPGNLHTIALDAPVLPNSKQTIVRETAETLKTEQDLLEIQAVVEKDNQIYSSTSSYPGPLAQILNDGFVRQQRIVSIGLFPIQYNPTANELLVYESLQLCLTFEGEFHNRTIQISDSPFFEAWFQDNLENYDDAKAWRVIKDIPSPTEPEEFGLAQSESSWVLPDPAWRITIKDDGVYYLGYADLAAAKVPVEILDPDTVQIFHLGSEIAIQFDDFDTDGNFDPEDGFIFYGTSTTSKYADKNVYWLTYGNVNQGSRMAALDGTPTSATTPSDFLHSSHLEENHKYISGAEGDDDLERYLWTSIFATGGDPKSWESSFELPAPSDGSGELTVRMLGYTDPPSVYPDHHARVFVNDTELPDAESTWDGYIWHTTTGTIPPGTLSSGENTIKITLPNDTGSVYEIIYIDWMSLDYPSSFQADQDSLTFSYPEGTWQFDVQGFTADNMHAYDITDLHQVAYISNGVVHPHETTYSYQFQRQVHTDEVRKFTVLAESAYQTPESIEAVTYSMADLSTENGGADYILITHSVFWVEAQDLAAHRQAQGWRTILVDVQQVYDQFNFGIESAHAIQDFLAYAYDQWAAPAPSFVVLMGDGHYDPKNYENYNRTSFIPPYMAVVDPWINETAADNRYVTLVGEDKMPDMMIGRLSVENAKSAAIIVDKLIQYDQDTSYSLWKKHILAIADNADLGGNFPLLSDQLVNDHLPEDYLVDKVYWGVTHTSISPAKADILSTINSGVAFVNFIGHGDYNGWTSEQIFTVGDVPSLNNKNQFFVVLSMTCYDGFFHRPGSTLGDYRALAEVITRAKDKGAVASWSPTGLGLATGHDQLNTGFFDAVFFDSVDTLGEAALSGKLQLWNSGQNLDLLETYTLFGDPAMKIWTSEYIYYFMPLITH